MKKRIVSITLLLVMLFAFSSCVISDEKYDYNMEKYITLPSYDGYKITLELDSIQAAVDSHIMERATEYVVKKGDDIYINVTAYDVIYTEGQNGTLVDQKSKEPVDILKEENMLLSNVGAGVYAQKIELSIIGTKIGEKTSLKTVLPDNFKVEEYRGKEVYVDVTVKTRKCVEGDVVVTNYTGYYLDDEGNKIVDTEKSTADKTVYKTFDKAEGAKFFLGAHLAIDDFEEGIVGMMVGETKSFKATFPEDYSNEDLKGKTVEFELTLKGLYAAPIYNDDYVKTYFPNYKTTKEYEDSLRESYILDEIYQYIVKNSKVIKYPRAELKTAKKDLKDIEKSFVEEYGVELDAYIEAYFGMTRQEYIESNLKSEMVYYAIRQKENVKPTAEQLLEETDSLIAYYKEYFMSNEKLDEKSAKAKATEFVSSLGGSYTYENVLFRLIDDLLIEKADVTEKERTHVSITEKLAEADKPVTE